MTLKDRFRHFPAELLNGNLFAGWRYKKEGPDGGGVSRTPTKPPFNVITGRLASPIDPAHWHDIGTVADRIKIAGDGGEPLMPNKQILVDGIGRRSNYDSDRIYAIDLDNVVSDGVLSPLALQHLKVANSYAELSVSRKGLRIFLRGELPGQLTASSRVAIFCKHTLDEYPETELVVYIRNSYVTISGYWIEGMPTSVCSSDEYIEFLLSQLKVKHKSGHAKCSASTLPLTAPSSSLRTNQCSNKTPEKVIEEISRCGKLTQRLFLGKVDGNPSRLDLQFCHKLVAFCDRDPSLMDAVIRQSPHFAVHNRAIKWDRPVNRDKRPYGAVTIEKALTSNNWDGTTGSHTKDGPCTFPPDKQLEPRDWNLLFLTRKFRATYEKRRTSFHRHANPEHVIRDYAVSLLYHIQCIRAGPGKGLALVREFLKLHFPDFDLTATTFWYFWRRAEHQHKKTGHNTADRIQQKSQAVKGGRRARGFGRTPLIWALYRRGKTASEIASAVGSNNASIRQTLHRIKQNKYPDKAAFIDALNT